MSEINNENKGNLKKDPNRPFGGSTPQRPKFNPYWIYGIIGILFLIVNYYFTGSKGPVETNWNKVKSTMLANHDIERIVVINNEKALITLKSDRIDKYKTELEGTFSRPAAAGPHFYFVIGSVETFEQKLTEAQKGFAAGDYLEAEYRNERNWLNDILWSYR